MMLRAAELHALPAGENLMPAMLFVPLAQRGGHMHLLDDVPPTHPGVVSAKRNLTFLRGVGDDALLGPPEIVVEQVLEPHARHEQQVPAVAPATENVVHGPLARYVAVVASRSPQPLVELPQHIDGPEMLRRMKRMVIPHQRQRHPRD